MATIQGEKPVPDSYVVEYLKQVGQQGHIERSAHRILLRHAAWKHPRPSERPVLPNVTALVTFTHPNNKRGYSVARRNK